MKLKSVKALHILKFLLLICGPEIKSWVRPFLRKIYIRNDNISLEAQGLKFRRSLKWYGNIYEIIDINSLNTLLYYLKFEIVFTSMLVDKSLFLLLCI